MRHSPTRLKVDIRDHWAKEDTRVQSSFAKLSELVGYGISCDPEWPQLWIELKPFFTEPSTFIPIVSGIVAVWCESLYSLLDNEANEDWAEQVIEELSKNRSLKIVLEIRGAGLPTTKLTEDRRGFTIFLPKAKPPNPSLLSSNFNTELLACFTPEDADAAPNDSWADVEIDSATGQVSTREEPVPVNKDSGLPVAPVVNVIPDINSLERPDHLFLRPPYHLIITGESRDRIDVQCSHPPTLKFLEGYLKKWSKSDMNKTGNVSRLISPHHACNGKLFTILTNSYSRRQYS